MYPHNSGDENDKSHQSRREMKMNSHNSGDALNDLKTNLGGIGLAAVWGGALYLSIRLFWERGHPELTLVTMVIVSWVLWQLFGMVVGEDDPSKRWKLSGLFEFFRVTFAAICFPTFLILIVVVLDKGLDKFPLFLLIVIGVCGLGAGISYLISRALDHRGW